MRWEPNAAERLTDAALQLFEEHGFEQTTVEAIATSAGLTKRTFFRHFADKREVLFPGGGQPFSELVAGGAASAPASASPLEAVAAAFEALGPTFAERHAFARRRQAVIAASPELQERELVKLARVSADLAEALRARGVTEPDASLVAEAGMAAFRVGFRQWTASDGRRPLPEVLRESLAALRAVAVQP